MFSYGQGYILQKYEFYSRAIIKGTIILPYVQNVCVPLEGNFHMLTIIFLGQTPLNIGFYCIFKL
jgi:hypothetical protein